MVVGSHTGGGNVAWKDIVVGDSSGGDGDTGADGGGGISADVGDGVL